MAEPNIAEALAQLASKVESTRKVSPNSGTEKVLFVDDEDMIVDISAESLRDLGYQVRGATSAQQAIEILMEGFEPQIMCCDIVMPGSMNGVELARQVHGIMPSVKVLLVSGYGAGSLDGLTNQDGFRLLSKPYTMDELAGRVRSILDDRI